MAEKFGKYINIDVIIEKLMKIEPKRSHKAFPIKQE